MKWQPYTLFLVVLMLAWPAMAGAYHPAGLTADTPGAFVDVAATLPACPGADPLTADTGPGIMARPLHPARTIASVPRITAPPPEEVAALWPPSCGPLPGPQRPPS